MTSIKRNYIYNLLYQVLAVVVPFITTPYVSRVLGAQGIGAYSYTYGIVSYFGIFAMTGTATYGLREISKRQLDRVARSQKFWEIFFFRFGCTAIVTIAYVFFFMNFMPEYRVLYKLNLLTVFSWVVDVSWYFQGVENFRVTAIRNSLVKILGTVFIFIFVKSSGDVWLYTMIYCGTAALGNLTMLPFLSHEVDKPHVTRAGVLSNAKPIMGLFLPVIAMQVYTVLDKTMLGSLNNIESVGYYTQADKIIQMVLTVLASLMAVLLPRISLMFEEKRLDKVNHYFQRAVDYSFMLAIPCIVTCIGVSSSFVPLFFGPGYDPVVLLMNMLSPLFIILNLGQMFGNFLIASNNENHYTTAVVVAAVVNFVLNVAMIPTMGSVGTVIATLTAESISTGLQGFYLRNLIDLSYLPKAFARYAVSGALMALAIAVVALLGLPYFAHIFLSVIVGIGVYGGYLLIRRDEFLLSIYYASRFRARKKE